METLVSVQEVLVEALDLSQAPGQLTTGTPLMGALPELDSMGVVVLAAALEERFGITIEDEEFSEELFETVGSLTDFIEAKLTSL